MSNLPVEELKKIRDDAYDAYAAAYSQSVHGQVSPTKKGTRNMKIESKSQSVVFHAANVSIEAIDMAEQGFVVLVWSYKGTRGFISDKRTIKGFDALMAFVSTFA